MSTQSVTVILETPDRTRRAQVTVPRATPAGDLVKVSRKKWKLPLGMRYNVVNLSSNRLLSPYDLLLDEIVQDGDTLMLQPLPTHGDC